MSRAYELKSFKSWVQKCGRAFTPRDHKLGVRERDLKRRSNAEFIILSAIIRQSSYVCATKNFCALLKFTGNVGTNVKLFSGAQLIWIQQPLTEKGKWILNPITNSSMDVGGNDFRVMKVRRAGKRNRVMLIVVAGRRTGTLAAYWVDGKQN